MAYQPPSSSKYGPPLDFGGASNKPSPFARVRGSSGIGSGSSGSSGSSSSSGFDSAAASAFQSRRTPADGSQQDWTAFGANKRTRRDENTSEPSRPSVIVDVNRNSLSAFVQAATGSLPPAPEEKWSQSAIRRPPTVPKKSESPKAYEDLFPTLGSNKSGSLSKSQSTESLSFADLMKKRVSEEEEARRLQSLEEERLARQREEEERQGRMLGIVHRMRVGNNSRVFETPDEHDEDMAGDNLDADAYGFQRREFIANHGDSVYDSETDDYEPMTPPYT